MLRVPIKRFHFFSELVKYDTLNIGFAVIESGGVVGCFLATRWWGVMWLMCRFFFFRLKLILSVWCIQCFYNQVSELSPPPRVLVSHKTAHFHIPLGSYRIILDYWFIDRATEDRYADTRQTWMFIFFEFDIFRFSKDLIATHRRARW